MSLDFLTPLMTLFWVCFPAPKAGDRKSIQVHTEKHGFPELEKVQLAIIGVQESRNSYYPVLDYDMDAFRREFYQLYPGNWSVAIADLGDLPSGESTEDTYHALSSICSYLKKKDIIPIVLGGSQDLTVALYRSFHDHAQWVNIVSVDNRFDFSQDEVFILVSS